jgi:hypothetical protein
MKFPWRKSSVDELQKEFNKLKDKANSISIVQFPIKRSFVGYACANILFQKQRLNTRTIHGHSTIHRYNTATHHYVPKKMDAFAVAIFITHPPAHFPIFATCQFYTHFKAKRVFDPFAGWGDRCIAAMACDIDYLGVDSNTKLTKIYQRAIKLYPHSSNVRIFTSKVQDIPIKNFDFDLVLTSPPFYDNTTGRLMEMYPNAESNYDTFMKECLIPVMTECLSRHIFVCLHLPPHMHKTLCATFGPCHTIYPFYIHNSLQNLYCWKISN